MTNVGYVDPFGSLAGLPNGVDLPEITPAIWGARHRIDQTLPWVLNLVRASGVTAKAEEFLAVDARRRREALGLQDKPGRPSAFPVEAVVVCLFMCKLTGRALESTEVARFGLRTLDADQRASLGIKDVLVNRVATPRKDRYLLDDQAVAARVERVMLALDNTMNPSEHAQPRKNTLVEEKETLRRDVTPERLAEAQDRIDQLVAMIMSAPVKAMPRALRRQYKGDAAVDGTPIPLHLRAKGKKWVPHDVTAGWYTRTKPTSDRDVRKAAAAKKAAAKRKGKGKGEAQQPKTAKPGFFCLEMNLVVATDSTPGPRQYFPAVPLGFAMSKPATAPDANALRVLRRLADAGIVRRHLGQDRLYPNLTVDNWHDPVRGLGWMSVFDLRVDWLGAKDSEGGALHVEGLLYCPFIPTPLVEATVDLREKKITPEQYAERIKRRAAYRLTKKESARVGADGTETVRLQSPAAGTSPKVICPMPSRTNSTKPHVILQRNGSRDDIRETVDLDDIAERYPEGVLPEVCTQGSVSVDKNRLIKFQQELVFGSPEHAARLRAMRQSQEGYHGYAKRDAHEALGRADLRPKRGLFAQSLYAAIGLAVSFMRKTVWFLLNAQVDEQGRMWVARCPRDKNNPEAPLGATGGYVDFVVEEDEEDDPPDVDLWEGVGA